MLINKIYYCIGKIFSYTNIVTNSQTNTNTNSQTNTDTETNFKNILPDPNQIKKINVIVNSWVSFKNLDGYSENYNMFPELLNLASEHNIIATEWEYQDDIIYTIIKSSYHFGNLYFKYKKIIYIDTDINSDSDSEFVRDSYLINGEILGKKSKKHKKNDYFVIDFFEPYLLKMINYTD